MSSMSIASSPVIVRNKQPPARTRRFKPAAKKQSQIFTKYVGVLKAKPQATQKMSLGNYSPAAPAKGYSIKLRSRADLEDPAIDAQVVMTGSTNRYELTLHLKNGSDKAVTAEVWQM